VSAYDDGWEFGDPCVECGEETSAEWRRYCDACWAAEHDDDERALDHELDQVDAVSAVVERCPDCGTVRVLFPAGGRRLCIDCRSRKGKAA
jgi:hypothetical protein